MKKSNMNSSNLNSSNFNNSIDIKDKKDKLKLLQAETSVDPFTNCFKMCF